MFTGWGLPALLAMLMHVQGEQGSAPLLLLVQGGLVELHILPRDLQQGSGPCIPSELLLRWSSIRTEAGKAG